VRVCWGDLPVCDVPSPVGSLEKGDKVTARLVQ
jgi:hypothetical protein